jgi:hypothetical protein
VLADCHLRRGELPHRSRTCASGSPIRGGRTTTGVGRAVGHTTEGRLPTSAHILAHRSSAGQASFTDGRGYPFGIGRDP